MPPRTQLQQHRGLRHPTVRSPEESENTIAMNKAIHRPARHGFGGHLGLLTDPTLGFGEVQVPSPSGLKQRCAPGGPYPGCPRGRPRASIHNNWTLHLLRLRSRLVRDLDETRAEFGRGDGRRRGSRPRSRRIITQPSSTASSCTTQREMFIQP